jgi:hypothetical protein
MNQQVLEPQRVRFINPLHVRCGDDILDKLKAAELPGSRMKWCDPVCVGPTPRTENPQAWYRMRAEHLGHFGDEPLATIEAELRAQDKALLEIDSHDLFDQSILIALLTRLADQPAAKDRLHLVTTDRFPGYERFIGLGQLTPHELRTLYETAAPVTDDQIDLARRAWDAWRSADPRDLQRLMDSDTAALPFLALAIRRHLQELPWVKDGLSFTERLVLATLESERMTAGELFERVQAAEEHPWMGDLMLFEELERLRFLPSPPVRVASDGPIKRKAAIESTELASQILDGTVNALSANAIDRWVGGVHVTSDCPWRWDGRRVAVVQG